VVRNPFWFFFILGFAPFSRFFFHSIIVCVCDSKKINLCEEKEGCIYKHEFFFIQTIDYGWMSTCDIVFNVFFLGFLDAMTSFFLDNIEYY
jgi:hypothetical protein